MDKKKLLYILLIIVFCLITSLFVLTALGWNKSCGGFTGETGVNSCNSIFKCSYSDNYPDHSGKCKLKIFNL